MDLLHFFIAAFALLILPGPTNTVLALSAEGLTPLRFTSLLAIVVSAYAAVVIAVSGIGGPLLHEHPAIAQGVKLLAATWVLYLAFKLWAPNTANAPVAIGRKQLFVTTLLNPKAIIIGLTMMPSPAGAISPAALGVFVPTVIATSSVWLTVGRLVVGRSTGMPRIARRLGAAILVMFSITLTVSAIS
ncbi:MULTISPECIES: threonine transporter RhtB [Rhizobium]|uniref:Threonine/homoserine/homoserine lactone efflux protein n=1 Tax=Rhizobium paranaense TaxID=1650438 RepID=A0A7W8XXX5_9HYPH|nr:threonine transporter RhtB [Rhizobium paranaense]MBB5577604.1 threonine/homoserine/homoserine lactone efflux protein [Rhizobium paranaense]